MISVLYFPPTKIGMTTTDPIYGEFTLPPNLQRAMKHPAFQRLDRIAQLGFSMFCPGMEHLRHTRAEHSKGVAYLAGVLGEILNLEPPDTELLQMTALLHDSGHGPFSHSFELVTPLRHEIRSQQVAALILEDIYSPEQISSVCYLIDPHGEAPTPNAAMLCDIVANKRCDVDIDKLDYLMRDSYYAGIPFCKFPDVVEFFKHSRIVLDPKRYGIWSFESSQREVLRFVFEHRAFMFETVYYSPNNLTLDLQMVKAAKQLDIDCTELSTFLEYDDTTFLAAIATVPAGQKLLRGECDPSEPRHMEKNPQTAEIVIPKIPFL